MPKKPHTRIKWTLENSAAEFGINPRTLSARLKQASIDPDANGFFSTVQIVRAIYNDLESERIRETRSKADLNEQQLRKNAGELVDVNEFAARYEKIAISMVRIIRNSKLTEAEQSEMLKELETIHKTTNENQTT